jgi:ABC-type multidrug transport system fused ATPase/permease subunit
VLSVLFGLSRGYRGRLVITFFLGVARVAALIGVGAVSALTVLAVQRGRPVGGWLIALFVVAPLAGLLHWLESWLAHDVAYRLLADMRLRFFRALDALAPAYLTRRRTGDLVGVATHDIELIEYFFAHTIAPAFVGVLVPAVVLGVLLAHGWPMALVLAPFLGYVALGPVWGRARIDRLSARAREAAGALNAHAVDSIQGLAEVARSSRSAPGRPVRGARRRLRGGAHAVPPRPGAPERPPGDRDGAGRRGRRRHGGGAGRARRARARAGAAPHAARALGLRAGVGDRADRRQLADTFAATQRLHAVHAEPVTVTDGPGVPPPAAGDAPALEMARVSFGYPGRPRLALDDVSLSVPAGSTVALVGPSGAGKTTVANLFLRFWDPAAGEVRLHGHDLRRYRLDDLRARIALVAQDTYLFNDTLRANIRLARPGASDADVAAAVERAALREFVESLPEGLDTVVGERGAQLSGGQRQRVAIARAFLKDAPVLILDEATSHLDAVSEQEVRRALDRLARGRTTVVIAHRSPPCAMPTGSWSSTTAASSRRDPRRAPRGERALPAPRRPPGRRRARRPRLTAIRRGLGGASELRVGPPDARRDPHAGDDREDGGHDDQGRRDRPGDEDGEVAARDLERLPERLLHERAQDERQDQRRQRHVELLEEIAQDAEGRHHPHVEHLAVDAVGADHAEPQDEGEQDRARDLEDLHPERDQRQVQDQQDDVADAEARDHAPGDRGVVAEQEGARMRPFIMKAPMMTATVGDPGCRG